MYKIVTRSLPEEEYFQEEHTKTQIYIHHTVGGTIDSTFNWWLQDNMHVATAYLIDKDGTVYKLFNPEYWAYHLGLSYGYERGFADKQSVGIELINEGPLKEKNGRYYWFDGKIEYDGKVFEKEWRGYKYWAQYTDEQICSTAKLVNNLTKYFNIPKQILTNFNFDKNYATMFNGILFHHNVRKDKTDVSPAFSMHRFLGALKDEND